MTNKVNFRSNMSSSKLETKESEDQNAPKRDECAICLETIKNRAKTDPCMHAFDYECICEWLKVKDSCPTCRTKVLQLMYDIQSDTQFKTKPIVAPINAFGVFNDGPAIEPFTVHFRSFSEPRRQLWSPFTYSNANVVVPAYPAAFDEGEQNFDFGEFFALGHNHRLFQRRATWPPPSTSLATFPQPIVVRRRRRYRYTFQSTESD